MRFAGTEALYDKDKVDSACQTTRAIGEALMPDSITTQIVGAHFRPPAKALLACLPAGHQLWLRPEPTNEYDENAVQVLLRSTSLQPLLSEPFIKDELDRQLSGQGFDLESVLAQPEWHLGFLPKAAKGNPALQEWNVGVQQAIHQVCDHEGQRIENELGAIKDDPVVACLLSFDSAGKPICIIPWPPTASTSADGTLPPAGELPDDSTPGNFSSADDNTGTIES